MERYTQTVDPDPSALNDEQIQVSTISAGELLGTHKLKVPPFQRYFTWDADDEVEQLWADLSGGIQRKNYFLGMVILSQPDDGQDELVLIDGQQRIATIILLANAVRLKSLELGRRLWAESFEASMGLDLWRAGVEGSSFSFDKADDQSAMVNMLAAHDIPERGFATVAARSKAIGDKSSGQNSKLFAAQDRILKLLEEDLIEDGNRTRRLREWAAYLSDAVYFAVIFLPDIESGFEVYEIVNSRGRDLTMSELVKAYLIKKSNDRTRTAEVWKQLEGKFEGAEGDPMTSFIRHSLIMDLGFFNRRDLYRMVRSEVGGPDDVISFFCRLEERAEVYKTILDPEFAEPEAAATKAFKINHALNLRTIRPILMAISMSRGDQERAFIDLMKVVVPRATVGAFGTGAIEARFANAAHKIHSSEDQPDVESLLDLKPKKDQFVEACQTGVSKPQALVLRSAALSGQVLPTLEGTAHQLVTSGSQGSDEFGYWDSVASKQLGNWILLTVDRRPYGTKDLGSAAEKFPDYLARSENLSKDDFKTVTTAKISKWTDELLDRLVEVFYEGE